MCAYVIYCNIIMFTKQQKAKTKYNQKQKNKQKNKTKENPTNN